MELKTHVTLIRVLYRCLFLFPVPAHNNYNNNRTTFSVDPDTHIDSIEQAEEMTIEGTSKWSCKIQITGIDAAFYEEQHADLHAELFYCTFCCTYLPSLWTFVSLYLFLCHCHFIAQTRYTMDYIVQLLLIVCCFLGMHCRFLGRVHWKNLFVDFNQNLEFWVFFSNAGDWWCEGVQMSLSTLSFFALALHANFYAFVSDDGPKTTLKVNTSWYFRKQLECLKSQINTSDGLQKNLMLKVRENF